MSRDGIMNFLSLNKGLSKPGGEVRQLRLPTMNPFPKLNGGVVRSVGMSGRQIVSRPVACGRVVIEGEKGQLPEMATDLIDSSAGYALENVKRERSRAGFGQFVGRMLDGRRAARV